MGPERGAAGLQVWEGPPWHSPSALTPAGGERVVERVTERLRGLQPWRAPAGHSAFLTHVRSAGSAAAPKRGALGRGGGWVAALQAPLLVHGQGLRKGGKLRRNLLTSRAA